MPKTVSPAMPRRAQMPLDSLLLDSENPRLASGFPGEPGTQNDLLKRLWTEMAVDEVALSIAANGYYQEEPLLVTPQNAGTDEPPYIVIEGNRRLAAVRLLTDKRLRTSLKANLPEITIDVARTLESLPVIIYASRKDVWAYLGFRHINGAKPWDAFSKAQYVASVHETYRIPLDEIAARIGDQHATVRRLYRGITVLLQAESQAGFARDDIVKHKFFFSHLYTAVDQAEFQKFIGITAATVKPNPVPKQKLGELQQLMTWIYGRKSTGTEPVVRTQFPDLNLLRDVISNPTSLSALRSGFSLDHAHELSVGDERRLRESLVRANEELRRAKGSVVQGFQSQLDLISIITDIVTLAESIQVEMQSMADRGSNSSARGRSRSATAS